MITQKELKEIVYYCKQTGKFVNKRRRGGLRKGAILGTIDRYIKICIKGKIYSAHRLAWFYVTGEWPDEIDHINQNKTDNRFCNLRNISHKDNSRNNPIRKTNKSGVMGVFYWKNRRKWTVSIGRKKLGVFVDFFEACCVRKSAEHANGYHENHGCKIN